MGQYTARLTFAESFGCARDWWHLVLISSALVPVSIAFYVILSNGGYLRLRPGTLAQRYPLSYLSTSAVLEQGKQRFLKTSAHTAWRTVRIRAGESLADVFAAASIASTTLRRILKSPDAKAQLSDLRTDRFLQLRRNRSGRLLELRYDLDAGRYLDIVRSGQHFETQTVSRPTAKQRHLISAHIEGSLYKAAQHAGISLALATKFVHLYEGHIDFRHDARRGDSFEILYEGEGVHARILAADIDLHNKHHQIFRFPATGGSGKYYNQNGRPLRSGIVRAPLDYTRISSRFSYHRMNPVLHVVRPHYGVDYAAPIGTPVKAAADGKITFCGRGGGYGRLVVIRSFKHYKTYYAHLHRFAKGISAGDWVQQGKVIGYVGESGIATGPHLHFGIQVSGKWKNPLTVQLPQSHALPHTEIARFRRHISPFVAALDGTPGAHSTKPTMVADTSSAKKSHSEAFDLGTATRLR